MIDSFIMLSDEDKADVVNNIDTYSLDDIESKLCVLCVRKKVNFNLDEQKNDKDKFTYNLNDPETKDDIVSDWVQAVQSNMED